MTLPDEQLRQYSDALERKIARLEESYGTALRRAEKAEAALSTAQAEAWEAGREAAARRAESYAAPGCASFIREARNPYPFLDEPTNV